MPNQIFVLDWVVIVGYLLLMLGVGVWFAKRSSSTHEFTSAGGNLPGWVVGLSIFGTFVSSISFLANPGKAYASNWNAFVFSLSLPLAAFIATRYFVPMYRRDNSVSAYHHLEKRFGSWARVYAGICFLLTQIARMATINFLVAQAIAPLTGWSISSIILCVGVLVTIYTLLGGIEAVIWTDAIQSLVLTVGLIATVGVISYHLPDDFTQIIRVATEDNKFSLGSLSASFTEQTFWVVLLYGLFINLQNFGIDQTYVQRYLTAKSEADAKRSVWLGALLYIPISALLFLVGTSLFAFYRVFPDRLPAGTEADAVFPHFIVHEFPAGMTGLLIASVLAAAMSSVDSSLNSSATLVYEDWYKRFFRKDPTDAESMSVLYFSTLIFGLLGTGASLAMIGAQTVLDVWWNLASIFSGGMLGLFLLGFLSKRATKTAALPATLVGVTLIVWMSVSKMDVWPASLKWLANPLHDQLTIVIGTTVLLVVGLSITSFLQDNFKAIQTSNDDGT